MAFTSWRDPRSWVICSTRLSFATSTLAASTWPPLRSAFLALKEGLILILIFLTRLPFKTKWINEIDWIVKDVGIDIEP